MEIDVYTTLQSNPNLLVFLTIGLGFLVGRIHFGSITLGATAGVLLAGLVLGHLGLSPEGRAGSIGFAIFMYSVGLAAGPRFFGVLRGSTLKYVALAAVTATTGVLLASQLSSWMGFEEGIGAGLLAGALTSTPTLAAAQDAVQGGMADLPPGMTNEAAVQNITVAYAITYVFGMIGLILFVKLMPRVFRVDLAAEAKGLEKTMHISAERDIDADAEGKMALVQAYEVAKEDVTGRSLKELELGTRYEFTVGRIKRGEEVFDAEPASTLQLGDKVSAVATFPTHQRIPELLGPRVQDPELMEARLDSCEVVVTSQSAVNRSLSELNLMGEAGIWVTGIVRSQVELPRRPDVVVQRGDVMYLSGLRGPLRALVQKLGQIESEIQETDIPTFAMGIVVGLLVGEFNVKFGQVSLTLGSAGGLLLSGILIGFLRSLNPTFGHVPTSARWVLQQLGLLFFMAGVGLQAGSGIVEALLEVGGGLVLVGVVVTLVPPVLSYLVGAWILRMNPAILLGGICGSMTSTPALSMVTQEAESEVPALGYAGTYTFANVMLTFAGSLLMRI